MNALDFPGHQPGDVYCLTRKEFVRFAGLEDEYYACLQALEKVASEQRGCPRNANCYNPEQEAFWAAIAATEIRRRFWKDEGMLPSHIRMASEEPLVEWEYVSTSGTKFWAIENRRLPENIDGAWGDTHPPEYFESQFLVTIPPHRDLPGRTHYESIRRGKTYRGL